MLDHYGSQDDPWLLEFKKPTQRQGSELGEVADENDEENDTGRENDASEDDASTSAAALRKRKSIAEVLQYLIEMLMPQRPRKFKLDLKGRIVRIVRRAPGSCGANRLIISRS